MSGYRPSSDMLKIMQSIIKRTRDYFNGEFGIGLIESDGDCGDVDSLTLHDITAILGMGGTANVLISVSFDEKLITILYNKMTSDFVVKDDEVNMFREATAGEIVNIILGHCTVDFQEMKTQTVSLTPPVILHKVKHIHRMKNAMFYTQCLRTEFGNMDINLVGPRELFNSNLEYVK